MKYRFLKEDDMFLVNDKEWATLSHEDKKAVLDFRLNKFADMETDAEIITLPSGTEFIVYADARGFIHREAK